MPRLGSQLRDLVRDELLGTYSIQPVIIERVDTDERRAVVSLKTDTDVLTDNVPIAAPYARDGYGDIHPVEPGDEAIALFTQSDMGDILHDRGGVHATDASPYTVEDAMLIPAHLWHDTDDVPDHNPGDRVIAHPSGAIFIIREDGHVQLEHATGAVVELTDIPPGVVEGDADQPTTDPRDVLDPEQYHPAEGGHVRVWHPAGVGLTLTERGVSIDSPHGRFTHAPPTDPEHVDYTDHRHLIPQADGTYLMSGPPIPHRELFAWFLDATQNSKLANADAAAFDDIEAYLADYLAWLESMTGTSLDPTNADTWPDPEHVPDVSTRDSFGTATQTEDTQE